MKLRNLAFAGSLLLALTLPAAAYAYQSVTTGAVNMRVAGTVKSARITTLARGTLVWVDYCARGWCLVTARRHKGWVSARFLGGTGAYAYRPPIVVFDFSIGRDHDWHHHRRHHHHHHKGCPPWVISCGN